MPLFPLLSFHYQASYFLSGFSTGYLGRTKRLFQTAKAKAKSRPGNGHTGSIYWSKVKRNKKERIQCSFSEIRASVILLLYLSSHFFLLSVRNGLGHGA